MNKLYAFQNYREIKPTVAGWYIWRLPHRFIDGLVIVFLTEYRKRGAGRKSVLSPSFDYWDGWRIQLPKGRIEWAEYDGEPPRFGAEVLEVVGTEHTPCPFCGGLPKWDYTAAYSNAGPINTNDWHLRCCTWAGSPRMKNPLELAEKRNRLLEQNNPKAGKWGKLPKIMRSISLIMLNKRSGE